METQAGADPRRCRWAHLQSTGRYPQWGPMGTVGRIASWLDPMV